MLRQTEAITTSLPDEYEAQTSPGDKDVMSILNIDELTEAVDIICLTVFDMPVSASLRLDLLADECMDARIEISGAWQGSVQVRASQKFLRLAASRVFLKEIDEVDRQDCIDTITEMTNMLGGSVKCMLPESCILGLPMIVIRDQDATRDDQWHYFDCAHQPIAVAVVGATTAEHKAA